jgi:hypothetical protein
VAEAVGLILRLSDPGARRPAVAKVQAERGGILRGGDAVHRLVQVLLR